MTRLSSRQFSLGVTFELDEVQESGVTKSLCEHWYFLGPSLNQCSRFVDIIIACLKLYHFVLVSKIFTGFQRAWTSVLER